MKRHKSNYAAWDINQADFPYSGSQEGQIKFLLGYGVLAPSQHNTQPWIVEVKGDTALIRPDQAKLLPVGDPLNYGLWISFGCFVENTVQAAMLFNISVDVSYGSNTITLQFNGTATPPQTGATDYIKQRFSYKQPFNDREIDAETMAVIANLMANVPADVSARIIADAEALKRFISIHMTAVDRVADNENFGHELANWLRSNTTKKADGMPGFVSGMPLVKSLIGPKLLSKKPRLLKKSAKQDEPFLESSKVICVWSVANTSFQNVIQAGRHIESVWLELAKRGLYAHPMIAATSIPETAEQLGRLAGVNGVPIFIMRVGYATDTGLRTPRKALN
jgi:hypothetical protein